MSTVIKANFRCGTDWKKSRGMEKGGIVQQTIDRCVMEYCRPYCPMETGALADSPARASPPGNGKVIYDTPYARYLYYGEVYGPNIPVFEDESGKPTRFFSPPGKKKHPTGKKLEYSKEKNPLAGSHWFERMKADHAEDIIREATEAAKNQ